MATNRWLQVDEESSTQGWAQADACLRCTTCLAVCPALEVYPHYAGPKRLGPDRWRQQCEAEGRRRTEEVIGDLDLCLGCRRCDQACPEGVRPERLMSRSRLQRPALSRPWRQIPRDWLLGQPDLLGKVGTTFARVANPLLPTRPVRFVLQHALGISGERQLPPFSRIRFSRLPGVRERSTAQATPVRLDPAGEGCAASVNGAMHPQDVAPRPACLDRVIYFPGCQVEYYEPELGQAVVQLLERLGVEVRIDAPSCCGLPAIANRWTAVAERRAQANVARLQAWIDAGYTLVVSSPSCALTLQTDYVDLNLLPPAVRPTGERLAERTLELGDFLLRWERAHGVRLQPTGRAGVAQAVAPVAYHTPCHGWSEKEGRPWLRLLRRLCEPVVDLNAGCCGIAGTYGLKQEKYATSVAVGEPLRQSLGRWPRPQVATECETCRMQIQHLVPAATVHHPLYWLGELRPEKRQREEEGRGDSGRS